MVKLVLTVGLRANKRLIEHPKRRLPGEQQEIEAKTRIAKQEARKIAQA
jgi:hypothetical protein